MLKHIGDLIADTVMILKFPNPEHGEALVHVQSTEMEKPVAFEMGH